MAYKAKEKTAIRNWISGCYSISDFKIKTPLANGEQIKFTPIADHVKRRRGSIWTMKMGGVSHYAARFWPQVLTPRDRMFTGEVNL